MRSCAGVAAGRGRGTFFSPSTRARAERRPLAEQGARVRAQSDGVMRIELSDGEMLELTDHEAQTLYETLLERDARTNAGRSLLRPSFAPLSSGRAELEPRLPSTTSRLKPCAAAREDDRPG